MRLLSPSSLNRLGLHLPGLRRLMILIRRDSSPATYESDGVVGP
jgi:hypothetical protein